MRLAFEIMLVAIVNNNSDTIHDAGGSVWVEVGGGRGVPDGSCTWLRPQSATARRDARCLRGGAERDSQGAERPSSAASLRTQRAPTQKYTMHT